MASLAESRRLNGGEETLLQKLVRSGHSLRPGTPTFPVESSSSQKPPYLRKKLTEDGEIDVFSADRYFNGGMDIIEKNMRNINLGRSTPRSYHSKTDDDSASLNGSGMGFFAPMVQPRTPSIHSQSSWSSQSALLRAAVMRNSAAKDSNKTNKVQQGKRFFANLRGCQCSCNDKKSTDIDDHISEHSGSRMTISSRPMRPNLDPSDIIKMKRLLIETDRRMKGEHCVSSPITMPLPFKIVERIEELEEARKSIEVFGAAHQELDEEAEIRRSLTHERRTNMANNTVNMLAWDAIFRAEEPEVITPPSGENHKDAESDASSDLFEIDCLSCMATPALACPQPDGAHDAAPTCYAPSEASIEWSVATASAADFPAAASDVEDLPQIAASDRAKQVPTTAKSPRKVNDELQKRRPAGILSGCRSEKAVSVAGGSALRSPKKVKFEPQRHRRAEPLTPMTRFQAESKASKERLSVVSPV